MVRRRRTVRVSSHARGGNVPGLQYWSGSTRHTRHLRVSCPSPLVSPEGPPPRSGVSGCPPYPRVDPFARTSSTGVDSFVVHPSRSRTLGTGTRSVGWVLTHSLSDLWSGSTLGPEAGPGPYRDKRGKQDFSTGSVGSPHVASSLGPSEVLPTPSTSPRSPFGLTPNHERPPTPCVPSTTG